MAINPTQALPEQSGADNSLTLPVGGLPPPAALTASPASDSLVLLQWLAR